MSASSTSRKYQPSVLISGDSKADAKSDNGDIRWSQCFSSQGTGFSSVISILQPTVSLYLSVSLSDLSYIPSYDLSIAHKLIDQQILKAQVELGAVLLRISLTEAGLLATNKRSEGHNANKSLRSMGDPIEQRNKLEVRLKGGQDHRSKTRIFSRLFPGAIKGFQREQMSVAFNGAVPVFGFVDSFGGQNP
nr:hypothetical protein Itr_chr08CG16280 [Ipomoea trifida]